MKKLAFALVSCTFLIALIGLVSARPMVISHEKIANIIEDKHELYEDIRDFRYDRQELRQDLANNEEHSEIRSDIQNLREGASEIKSDIRELKADFWGKWFYWLPFHKR